MRSILAILIFTSCLIQAKADQQADFLQFACEEVDHNHKKTGKVLIIDQIDSSVHTGPEMLELGKSSKTKNVTFSLRIYENEKLPDDEEKLRQFVDGLTLNSHPVNGYDTNSDGKKEGVEGGAYIVGNNFIFQHSGAQKVKFKLPFSSLTSASYYLDSRIRTSGFHCKNSILIKQSKRPDLESEEDEDGIYNGEDDLAVGDDEEGLNKT